ncbi:MFS transporter [Paraburkholderia sartisoli]|uniref:Predicted arabinose efflux permease, MFS family n=1 Tax=Paraburkholderia sartisoli TaxID=83784 RepID=A0A1H4D4J9_9BURK|nr:MFS transporter [Paraburkholderia sartisoli]SEA67557.1 Predicted arabinose efflux permease, MFS family [Paraburkholderia sartisoli]
MRQPPVAPVDVISASAESHERGGTKRLLAAASIGTAIEHYDFFCYAFVAPVVFGVAFFPRMDSLTGTLAVYTTFAIGFIARPLGGMVFGHFGDRIGRKFVLLLTLLLMGGASFLIGCLPTYASAGLWAPALLVLLRFLQGFAFGGEYMNAVTLMLEGAPTQRRGLFASAINASGPAGIIAASGLIAMLTGVFGNQAFQEWGWRLPFLLSIVMVVIGTYVRSQVDESTLFRQLQASKQVARIPMLDVMRSWKIATFRAVLINMVHSSFQYLCTVFVLGYAVKQLGMSAAGITTGTTLANVVEFIAVPLLAMTSDKWGRRPLILLGIAVAAFWFPVFLHIVDARNIPLLIAGMVVSIGLVHALMFAPEAAFTAEQFPTEVRSSGGSLGKQLGIVLGGGCAPLVATALMGHGGSLTSVVWYFEAIAVCAFVVILLSPESSRRTL